MARFIQEYVLQGSPDACFGAINQFLTQQGFKYTVYQKEQVFQKGEGWITAPTFFKISFGPDRVRVEAWMKYAILPGVFAGELGMTGFVGCAAKGTMKNCAQTLDRMMGGPAARIGCDPFLRSKNMNLQPAAPQPLPQQGYMPQQQMPQQQMPQSSVCRNCGAPVAPGASYCVHCGARCQ